LGKFLVAGAEGKPLLFLCNLKGIEPAGGHPDRPGAPPATQCCYALIQWVSWTAACLGVNSECLPSVFSRQQVSAQNGTFSNMRSDLSFLLKTLIHFAFPQSTGLRIKVLPLHAEHSFFVTWCVFEGLQVGHCVF
jgi:hypothetical protein